jgi:hypothetical protein
MRYQISSKLVRLRIGIRIDPKFRILTVGLQRLRIRNSDLLPSFFFNFACGSFCLPGFWFGFWILIYCTIPLNPYQLGSGSEKVPCAAKGGRKNKRRRDKVFICCLYGKYFHIFVMIGTGTSVEGSSREGWDSVKNSRHCPRTLSHQCHVARIAPADKIAPMFLCQAKYLHTQT